MSAMSLAAVLAASPTRTLRDAIVAALASRLPWVAVLPHPGKLDVSDVIEGRHVRAPALLVGVVRQAPREPGLGGLDVPVREIAVYVAVEDHVDGSRRIDRDELGHALVDAVIALALDDRDNRWGRPDIAPPEDVTGGPLFTRLAETGTAYYVVTWRQAVLDLRRTPLPAGSAPPFDPLPVLLAAGELPDPLSPPEVP